MSELKKVKVTMLAYTDTVYYIFIPPSDAITDLHGEKKRIASDALAASVAGGSAPKVFMEKEAATAQAKKKAKKERGGSNLKELQKPSVAVDSNKKVGSAPFISLFLSLFLFLFIFLLVCLLKGIIHESNKQS